MASPSSLMPSFPILASLPKGDCPALVRAKCITLESSLKGALDAGNVDRANDLQYRLSLARARLNSLVASSQ